MLPVPPRIHQKRKMEMPTMWTARVVMTAALVLVLLVALVVGVVRVQEELKVEVALRLSASPGPTTVLLLGALVELMGLVTLAAQQTAPSDEAALSEVADEPPSLWLAE